MNTLYFLIGASALLMALLFFSFIAVIWGLSQLIIIRNQNDLMISLLQQISLSVSNNNHIKARLQEDNGDTAFPPVALVGAGPPDPGLIGTETGRAKFRSLNRVTQSLRWLQQLI